MTNEAIRELRLALDMTQEQFAQAIGVSWCSISRWENGHAKPSRLAINKMKILREKRTA